MCSVSREVIKQRDDISDGIGAPDWQLCLWLLLAWVVVYLVIIKGVKSSGKVSYFLAMFPYTVLIALLIRAITLEGAWNGIKFFITPDFKKLIDPQVRFFHNNLLDHHINSCCFPTWFNLMYSREFTGENFIIN
jgi:SNF family Na+-dependent transporter